ncbi:hypothetical protein MNBD_GAMMA23-1278 [hydrothermal vent metagenome]|uniref:Uncharacterized protein n=1 Tax=hydrothermal vent metagenome TaxID=652676 RepID=A0A3B0ZU98_9ZZZZ
MDNTTLKIRKEIGLNTLQLRLKREQIYRRKVPHSRVFPQAKGRILAPASDGIRTSNFLKFVELYFSKKIDNTIPDPEFNIYPSATKMAEGSDGYKAFKRFAKTDYGSSVIKEMINNPKKYKGFDIKQGAQKWASAGYRFVVLPKKFPARTRFKTSGQRIYDLAIIYHEFAHTMVFQSKSSKGIKVNIKGERMAVMKFENPVRMRKGYEPRYSYTKEKPLETINIITGEKKQGIWVVSESDPTKLVKPNDKDALK